MVTFVVGLISGAILLWNNRQRPHDVLKTYVEIYTALPDGETKDRLWSEIAERLGMSARTVNQHVDNVADKLGTKNRTHTIAEVIRHGLLH